MTKRLIPLNGFNSVAAGQTATLTLPTRGTYHGLLLKYGTATVGGATQANMIAEITEVRLVVNDKVQRRFSATELFDLNVHRNITFATGFLPIYFAEPWRRTAQGEDALAWGMADVNTFQVEIDIAAGATSPTFTGKALWTSDQRPMGQIVKWRKHTIPVSATGIVNVTTLNKNDSYYGLHAHSANILDIKVTIDSTDHWTGDVTENDKLQSDMGLTPVAGWFHVDFDFTSRASDSLSMVNPAGGMVDEFQVDFNMSAATSFTLITETLGLRD